MDVSIVNKSELVIDAFQYGLDQNLDIANKDDVLKILKALNNDQVENVDEFMRLLNASEMFINIQTKKTDKKANSAN